MRQFDPDHPLIVIHVPKAAGSSSRRIFEAWFEEGFLTHYFSEADGSMPKKHDIFRMHTQEKPICLHGHFNRLRKFGVQDYYPEAKQFITILRDPFELTISHYFYTKKVGDTWLDQTRIPKEEIINHLLSSKPNMLNHFPRDVTFENYKDIIEEFFIEIGITEYLNTSMQKIANKLNFPYNPKLLGHHNATERDQEIPSDFRDIFIEKNPLEFAVYDYALKKHINN